eukprot:scaffold81242_cov60-Phaeocystis_antarctica.AAC.1
MHVFCELTSQWSDRASRDPSLTRPGPAAAGAGAGGRGATGRALARALCRMRGWPPRVCTHPLGWDLRHVLGECPGLPDRVRRVEELVVALDGVVGAVPQRPDTSAFLKLTRAARVALEWSDQVVLTEERWSQVDAVLAAFVPDLARKESTPVERKQIVWDVVEALQTVHKRAESAVQAWQ